MLQYHVTMLAFSDTLNFNDEIFINFHRKDGRH